MKLTNTLSIPVPAEEAWRVLLDVERIAHCVPGATLTSHDDDGFHGTVKVKLGPIALTYLGTVAFVSRDEATKVAVMSAKGRDSRGGGTAKATISCGLTDRGDTTEVLVETDLAITGKPAQFGRGTLADVATNLIDKFAANLADEIATPDEPAQPPTGSGVPAGGTASPATAEPIDLLPTATALLLRIAPIAAAIALLLLLARRITPIKN